MIVVHLALTPNVAKLKNYQASILLNAQIRSVFVADRKQDIFILKRKQSRLGTPEQKER